MFELCSNQREAGEALHGSTHRIIGQNHLKEVLPLRECGMRVVVNRCDQCEEVARVDEINRHIQQRRLRSGELDSTHATTIVGGTTFVGDVVATRHNDRSLPTTDGGHVRDREVWRIEAIDPVGSIVLLDGDRRVRLPAKYVEQFTLAYSYTEYGAQGITADESITLVTDSTTQPAPTWERHAARERT